MTAVDAGVRVCPSCGSPAGAYDACPACGTHLASLLELPTRGEWQARSTAGASAGWTPPRTAAAAPGRVPPLRPLLHPTELSRLALALVAALVSVVLLVLFLIALGSTGILPRLLATAVFSLAGIWIGLQIFRARMLGRSVRVGADTMPALQALIDDVRATLHYHRRVDFYVIAKPDAAITTTSYLGARIVVLEGSLVADLMEPHKRSQLTFLVGRSIGSLRAKHMRLDVVVLLLDALNVLRFPSLFILPWYRATSYSGDQIGMMCCGDLEAALEATRRVLVGGELAGKMAAGDVLPQATLVQRRILPRLAQLFMAEPYATNRYANLLCFGRYHDPELWGRMRASLDAVDAHHLEQIWARSPHRRRMARAGR
jgi:hypothetical protein